VSVTSAGTEKQAYWRGAYEAMQGPAFFVAVALTGIGGLARDVGHPVGAAMLSTLLIWAGPAQIILRIVGDQGQPASDSLGGVSVEHPVFTYVGVLAAAVAD